MAGFFRLLVVVVSLLLVSAAGAWAQNDPFVANPQPRTGRGQDRAVFGGGVGDADQVLSANSNVGATYFQQINNGANQDPSSTQLQDASWFGHGSAFLAYRLGWKVLR